MKKTVLILFLMFFLKITLLEFKEQPKVEVEKHTIKIVRYDLIGNNQYGCT